MKTAEADHAFQEFQDGYKRHERRKKTHAPRIFLHVGHPDLGVVKPVRIDAGGRRMVEIQVGFIEEISMPRYKYLYERVPSECEVRFMPSLMDRERKKLVHFVAYHRFFQTKLVCPKHTSKAALPYCEEPECPCCDAGLTCEFEHLFYGAIFSRKHNPEAVVFQAPGKYGDALNAMLADGAFDLDGHTYTILVGRDGLHWDRCRKSIINRKSLHNAHTDPLDLSVKPGSLQEMVKIQRLWEEMGSPRPQKGRADELLDTYPAATFVPVNFGTKRTTLANWQHTDYSDFRIVERRWQLDAGNIGIVFGPIPPMGLAAHAARTGKRLCQGALVVALDPDDEGFHQELLASNPWLRRTWAVKGARAAKYIFIVNGNRKAIPKTWEVTRPLRRVIAVCEDRAKYEDVGELLSTGHKGTVSGLHPSGVFYETVQDEPMYVLNDASEFKLPQDVILGTMDLRDKRCPHPFPSYKYEPPKLDTRSLFRVRKGVKGLEAQCPACAAEGKDNDCDNLLIYPDGHFMCARFIGMDADSWREHHQAILEEAGTGERGGYDDSEADRVTGHFDANYQRELFY